MISATIIEDSISPAGHRLTTYEATFHRFILAEVNTHRLFSRSSASSRAVPTWKNIQKVRDNPAIPLVWASEQKGMQGGAEVDETQWAEDVWRSACANALSSAEMLAEAGVHKSIVNRVLEPFMWHTAIITATSYENFFGLRNNPLAQPEFFALAAQMEAAYDESIPTPLSDGAWHRPYIRDEDWDELNDRGVPAHEIETGLNKVSAARCARVSYLTQAGTRDIDEDIRLYERLTDAQPPHSAPLEHVATPWRANVNEYGRAKVGNFVGWRQLRYGVETSKQVESYR